MRVMQVAPSSNTLHLRRPSRVASFEPLYRPVYHHGTCGGMLWAGILLLHTVCSAYYFTVAYIYAVLPSTLLAVNMQAFQLTIDMKYYPAVAAFHITYGTAHTILLLTMLVPSIIYRRLVFKLTGRRASPNKWLRMLRRLWQSTFGPLGIFGVDHHNFEALLVIRELTETALQSVQAYQMSQYVPRIWLNNFWVVMITINCWSTPLLMSLPRLKRRTWLMLALLSDVILDFLSSVGGPSLLIAAYIPYYDFNAGDFNADAWYSDLWFINMINEFRIIFTQSLYDVLTRAVFAASLLLCLDDIKILASTFEPSERARNSVAKTSFALRPEVVAVRYSMVKVAHRVLVLWGFVLVALHIEASWNAQVPGCQLQVRPWISSKTACSFLLIDCQGSQPPKSGNATEITASWEHVNPEMLALVTIQKCPGLEIPPGIQTLRNLVGFNIFASRIAMWAEDAALTAEFHPRIRHLGLLSIDFSAFGAGNGSTFPAGLVSEQFPTTLFDIFVWNCSWSALPPNLDVLWPKQANLLLPNNNFTHVPDVVLCMSPIRLMLDDNPLLDLPAALFDIKTLESIEVPRTALQSLPTRASGLPSGSRLKHLSIQDTQISILPEWMATSAFLSSVRVRAEGTPLCARISAGDPATVAISGHVTC